MPNDLRKMYDVGSQHYDLGDFDTFKSRMSDEKNRRKYYESMSEHYDLGDYSSFSSRLTGSSQKASKDSPQDTDEFWDFLPDVVKLGYNKSLTAMANKLAFGEENFDLSGYDPNVVEDIASTLLSFFMPIDLITTAAGGGIGGVVAKKAVLEGAKRATIKTLAKQGLSGNMAKLATEKASLSLSRKAASGAITQAGTLGSYSGVGNALQQKMERGEIDISELGKETLKGATIGAIAGAVGAAGGTGGKILGEKFGAGKKGLEFAGSVGGEIGAFGTAHPVLSGEEITPQGYVDAAGIILGMRAVKGAKRVLKVRDLTAGEAQSVLGLQLGKPAETQKRQLDAIGIEISKGIGKVRKGEASDAEIKEIDVKAGAFEKVRADAYKKTIEGLQKKEVSPLEAKKITDKAFERFYFDSKGRYSPDHLEPTMLHATEVKSIKDVGRIAPRKSIKTKHQLKVWNETVDKYYTGGKPNMAKLHAIYKNKLKKAPKPETDGPIEYEISYKPSEIPRELTPYEKTIRPILAPIFQATNKHKQHSAWRPLLKFTQNADTVWHNTATRYQTRYEGIHKKYPNLTGEQIERNEAPEVKKLMDDLWVEATDAGSKMGKRENYFPRALRKEVYDEIISGTMQFEKVLSKILGKDGIEEYKYLSERMSKKNIGKAEKDEIKKRLDQLSSDKAVIRRLKDIGGYTEIAIRNLMKKEGLSYMSALARIRYNAKREFFGEVRFEKQRELEFPSSFYESNPHKVIPYYIDVMSRRIAELKVFGKNRENSRRLESKLRAEDPKSYQDYQKIVGMWSGEYERFNGYTGRTKKFVNALSSWEVATKIGLGTAFIPNMTQMFISIVPNVGVLRTMQAGYKIMYSEHRKGLKNTAGFLRENTLQAYTGIAPEGFSGKLAKFFAKPFVAINRFNLYLAASAADIMIRDLHKISNIKPTSRLSAKRKLWALNKLEKTFGIATGTKLNQETVNMGVYRFAVDSQLQRNVLKEPIFFNDPKYRPLVLFKRFGYRQFVMMKDLIREEVKHGNYMPILYLAAGGYLGGEFVTFSKDWIRAVLTGEPSYREDVRSTEDEGIVKNLLKNATFERMLNNIASVGAFGVISDIVAVDDIVRGWNSFKFAVTPVYLADIMTIGKSVEEVLKDATSYGPAFAIRRTPEKGAELLGSIPKYIGKRTMTEPQRDKRMTRKRGIIRTKILDLMLEGKPEKAKIQLKLWNKHAQPRYQLTHDDVNWREVRKRLEQHYRSAIEISGETDPEKIRKMVKTKYTR